MQFKQDLETKNASASKQAAEQLIQLQQDMEVLKISHEADLSAKNMQLQELKQSLERYKNAPSTKEFIK